MAKSPLPSAESAIRSTRPRRSWRRGPLAAALVAVGAAGGFLLLDSAGTSPAEAVAVVRQRLPTRHGDDVGAAVDRIASEILSPAQIAKTLRRAEADDRRSEAELAAAAEAHRGRLRVDVAPGDAKRPWTITIRSSADHGAERAATVANALAEQYCRASQAAAVAQEELSYRAARTASEQARQAVEQAQQELDRRFEQFLRLAALDREQRLASPASPSPSAKTAAVEPPKRAAARRQLAELEARRDSLLERLLPAHPDVQSIEVEIAAARSLLGRLPPAASEPPKRAAPAETAIRHENAPDSLGKEVAQAAEAIVEGRRLSSQAAARAGQVLAAERKAAERLLLCQRDEVATVGRTAVASSVVKPGPQATLSALAFAVLAGWLAGRLRPRAAAVFHEPSELEAATGIPVVGVLSAEDRSPVGYALA